MLAEVRKKRPFLTEGRGMGQDVEAEIAEADNNDTTMDAILAAVQAQSTAVTVINVRTWAGEVLQKSWIWQNGIW